LPKVASEDKFGPSLFANPKVQYAGLAVAAVIILAGYYAL
jgi:hypothetical protein